MCGIFGIYNSKDATLHTQDGLFALLHRGHEGGGIAVHDGEHVKRRRTLDRIESLIPDKKTLEEMAGNIAIGGNRYSTVDSFGLECIQPLKFILENEKEIATAHNGTIVNFESVRRELQKKGAIFQSHLDSEIFGHLIAHAEGETLKEKIKNSFPKLVGAYSTLVMGENELIAVRDPWGFRPLELGEFDGGYVLASETCAFDLIGAKEIRQVKPGEIIHINEDGYHSDFLEERSHANCIFEYVYFSRPDSRINGKDIDITRRQLGRNLAREWPVEYADVVISVPDSGNIAAIGYAEESDIPFDFGLIRNHYSGRTFTDPDKEERSSKVRRKLNPMKNILEDKIVVIVDDSLVRGTTVKTLTQILFEAGAKEVHFRISSPPVMHPCYYGMDFPTEQELFLNYMGVTNSLESMPILESSLGVNSLRYLSLEGMVGAAPKNGYCTACFSGKYPTSTPKEFK